MEEIEDDVQALARLLPSFQDELLSIMAEVLQLYSDHCHETYQGVCLPSYATHGCHILKCCSSPQRPLCARTRAATGPMPRCAEALALCGR